MDKETKQYLEEKFATLATREELGSLKTTLDQKFTTLATKEDLVSVETRLVSTLGDIMILVDKRFDVVEDKLDSVVNQVSGHEKRISFLEDKVLH